MTKPPRDHILNLASKLFATRGINATGVDAIQARVRNPETLALQLSMVIEGATMTERMQRGSSAVDHATQAEKIRIAHHVKV